MKAIVCLILCLCTFQCWILADETEEENQFNDPEDPIKEVGDGAAVKQTSACCFSDRFHLNLRNVDFRLVKSPNGIRKGTYGVKADVDIWADFRQLRFRVSAVAEFNHTAEDLSYRNGSGYYNAIFDGWLNTLYRQYDVSYDAQPQTCSVHRIDRVEHELPTYQCFFRQFLNWSIIFDDTHREHGHIRLFLPTFSENVFSYIQFDEATCTPKYVQIRAISPGDGRFLFEIPHVRVVEEHFSESVFAIPKNATAAARNSSLEFCQSGPMMSVLPAENFDLDFLKNLIDNILMN